MRFRSHEMCFPTTPLGSHLPREVSAFSRFLREKGVKEELFREKTRASRNPRLYLKALFPFVRIFRENPDGNQRPEVERRRTASPPPHTHTLLVFRVLLVLLMVMGALGEHSACVLSLNAEQITALSTALLGEETEKGINDVLGAQQSG